MLHKNQIDFAGMCQTFDNTMSMALVVHQAKRLNRQSRQTKVVIDLSSNNIKHLNLAEMTYHQEHIFVMLLRYFELDLSGNPFFCDCKTYTLSLLLHRLVKEWGDEPSHYSSWRCTNVGNTPLLSVEQWQLQCQEKGTGCPPKCICKRSHDLSVYVYCQNKNLTKMPSTVPTGTVVLFLQKNQISTIQGFSYLGGIKHLDVSDNIISYVHPKALGMLQGAVVNLSGNKLAALPSIIKTMNYSSLDISHNVWKCDCNDIWMKYWLRSRTTFVVKWNQVVCSSGGDRGSPIIYVKDEKFVCAPLLKVGEIAGIVASCSLLVIIITLLLVYKYSTEIKVIMYNRFNWHPFDRVDIDNDPRKTHDLFIAYCGDDSDWVFDVLVEELENVHDPPYRTLFHARDFAAGASIAENIVQSVDRSKRMVMVLYEAFLDSHWCMFEFHTAHARVVEEHHSYIIIILLDDVRQMELDETLRSYMRTHTYLSIEDKWFWKKLYYALPPVQVREAPQQVQRENERYALF